MQSNLLVNVTVSKSVLPAYSLSAISTAFPESQAISSSERIGQVATMPPLRAVSASSSAAATESPRALAGASSSTDAGSEVSILGQIIIAIGVLPVLFIIVAIMLGIHRLVHRRSSQPLQTRVGGAKPTLGPLPFLQPKAELEDEQKGKYELHGEHLVHELSGQDEIRQIADDADDLVLSLQGGQGVHEMLEEDHARWEMPTEERNEVMGDEYAQELESPIRGREQPVRVEDAQELESPVRARNEPMVFNSVQELESPVQVIPVQMGEESMRAENAQGLGALGDESGTDSANVNPSPSHFMLRQQQQMADLEDLMTTDQQGGNEKPSRDLASASPRGVGIMRSKSA